MMKLYFLALLNLSLFGMALAQNSSAAPDVQVVSFEWREFRLGNLKLESGVSAASAQRSPDQLSNERQLEVLRQNAPDNKEQIAILEQQKRRSELPDTAVHSDSNPSSRTRYKYTLEVKNTGQKTIVKLRWDYIFLDPRQQKEAVRHHFSSQVKINTGAKKKVTIYTDAMPYRIVSANANSQQSNEQIIIKEIAYADGSVWKP